MSKVGRKKQGEVRVTKCVKVSPGEREQIKRYLEAMRKGVDISPVVEVMEELDLLECGIQKAADGERLKTSFCCFDDEWKVIQPFAQTIMRCTNNERLKLAEVLEQVDGGGVNALFVIVWFNGEERKAVVVDDIRKARCRYRNILDELGVDGAYDMFEGYTSENNYCKVIKISMDTNFVID